MMHEKRIHKKAEIRQVIQMSAPVEKKPFLNEKQIEGLKTAGEVALAILLSAGILTLSVVAPNIFSAFGKLYRQKRHRQYSSRELQKKVERTFYYLKSKGLIRMRPVRGDFKLFITALAKRKIKHMQFNQLRVEKPKKWDKKWWLVAADIPTEEYKFAADALRDKLKQMDFFPLQRTLWLYPHDPRLEVDWIMRVYGIGRFVTMMEITRLDIDDEEKIVKHFHRLKIL